MSIILTVNGVDFAYPELGDENWGQAATNWAEAVTSGMLQKAGGDFPLTADVDFGADFGLKSLYYKTRTTNPATAGQFRLARADVISWRNQANGANLDLSVNSSDVLQFNGEDIVFGAIVNADIDAAAAIDFSKMAALTASRALVSDGSGVVSVSNTTSTQIGYLSTASSDIQTQITARLPLAGGTMTGDLFLNADPSSSNQAATKQYVDNAAAGNVNNFNVRLATTAAVNLSNELEDGDTLDGETIATGDLILVKNQASTAANGIYVAPASGAASRYSGMDTWTEAIGASVFATEGTANAGTLWKFNTAAGGTLGVTPIPIVQLGASQVYTASGEGIELSGTEFSLELDGTTLSKSGTGLKVNEIANAQIAAAAAIAVNKLAALTASRAVVSDGSGFLASATTTATEIGYVNGLTSSAQTQIDGKISNTLTTTRGDMIYASAANTPARLAVGTSGYHLVSDGTDPVWTNPKTSYSVIQGSGTISVGTSFAALTLNGVTAGYTVGTAVSRSSNTVTFPYTGVWKVTLAANLQAASTRDVIARVRDTSASSTVSVNINNWKTGTGNGTGATWVMSCNVTSISNTHEIQLAASGSGVSVIPNTIDSTACVPFSIIFEYINI